MEYVKAFLVGGIICALVQILMEKTKLLPGRIMVLLVCTGSVLGFLNIYEPFLKFAGSICQMLRAYSPILLSDANIPADAMFMSEMPSHLSRLL